MGNLSDLGEGRYLGLLKKFFCVWITLIAVLTTYGALQLAWWLGVIVATSWYAAVLFVDAFFSPTRLPGEGGPERRRERLIRLESLSQDDAIVPPAKTVLPR